MGSYREISNRYAERMKLHPELRGDLEDDRDFAMSRLDEIESWLIAFFKQD